MENDSHYLNSSDTRRVVYDMEEDLRYHDLVSDYADRMLSTYRNTPVAKRLMQPIREQAQTAFRHNLNTTQSDASSRKTTEAFRDMPALYVSKAFKIGVALGTVANYRLLGKHTDTLLVPHIDSFMPAPEEDHYAYIEKIEEVAVQSYNLDPFGSAETTGGLLEFSKRVGEVLYDEPEQIMLLEIGTALAQRAYREYQLQTNRDFTNIVASL